MDNVQKTKDLYNRAIVKDGFVFNTNDYESDGKETLRKFEQFKKGFPVADIDDLLEPALDWYDRLIHYRLTHFSVFTTLDDKGYSRKLKADNEEDEKEIKNLNNRIPYKYKTVDVSELADKVGNQGYSFCAATFCRVNEDSYHIYRRKSNFHQQQIFALDFDGGISFEEVMRRAFKYKIPPIFAYKTFSCDDVELNKFRVVWVADFFANDIKIAEGITRLLMSIYPESDPACKDCCRLFYGGKGIIYKSEFSYLDRFSLISLCSAVEEYIKDEYPKDRLQKMREISQETGIVLVGGRLDVREITVNDEQFKQIVECAKEKEWNFILRCYLEVEDCKRILQEDLLEDDGNIYGIARKMDFETNKMYFIRMNKTKEIKKKVQNDSNKKTARYVIKSNAEYSPIKDRARGITRDMLCDKCKMVKALVDDEYLSFDELFGICTNLINIEGGLKLFKEMIEKSQFNKERSTDWANFKADQLNNQGLKPMKCINFCQYKEQCKHATNIINTVKTKRNTLQIIGFYDLVSLEKAMEKYEEIIKELFEDECC